MESGKYRVAPAMLTNAATARQRRALVRLFMARRIEIIENLKNLAGGKNNAAIACSGDFSKRGIIVIASRCFAAIFRNLNNKQRQSYKARSDTPALEKIGDVFIIGKLIEENKSNTAPFHVHPNHFILIICHSSITEDAASNLWGKKAAILENHDDAFPLV